MYILKLMDGGKYKITKEEAQSLVGKSGLVIIKSLKGMINIASISSILPEEIAEQNRKQTKDRQWCIKKFGEWYLESDPTIKVDLNYYPELKDKVDNTKKIEPPSKYGKKLTKLIK